MITNYATSNILKAMCGKSQYVTLASRSFLALSATEPTLEGTNVTEPVGNGYGRMQIGYHMDQYNNAMGDPVDGVTTNVREIHFNEATGNWGTLRYACIYDDEFDGHLLACGELGEEVGGEWVPAPITPTANTVVVIKVGNIRISIE